MIPTPLSPSTPPQQTAPVFPLGDPGEMLWIDQFNQNVLLTVQAFQRLYSALGQKFFP